MSVCHLDSTLPAFPLTHWGRDKMAAIFQTTFSNAGWETSARPLINASENLAGRVENRPGRVKFCIGYLRDYAVRASAKKI